MEIWFQQPFPWNAGSLSPCSIDQNGIDSISISYGLILSSYPESKNICACVCPSGVLQAHYWTILGFLATEISSLQYPAKSISPTPSMHLDSILVWF
jgi:hypothetical protein